MIHFHTLRSTDDQHWSSFVDTYSTSFPLDEQRPTASIAALLTSEERFTAMVLLDKDNNFVGILTTWTFDTFIYIEHFALHPALRSQGNGSIALQVFIQRNTLPIILEVEPPTDTLTQRRVSFYERCGLRLYDTLTYSPLLSRAFASPPATDGNIIRHLPTEKNGSNITPRSVRSEIKPRKTAFYLTKCSPFHHFYILLQLPKGITTIITLLQ